MANVLLDKHEKGTKVLSEAKKGFDLGQGCQGHMKCSHYMRDMF